MKPPFLSAKFVRISLPFAVILLVMLVLSLACMEILSAARAYVGGEGLWSKAQKDAVAYLTRYVRTRDAEEYRRFRDSLAIPLGDRVARRAMQTEPFDRRSAIEGFIRGGNHPDDVGRMIWLFRSFGDLEPMNKAIAVWTRGDAYVAQLDDVGRRIDARIRAGAGPAALLPLLDEVDRINQQVRPLEDEFSALLGAISRQVTLLLLVLLTFLAASLFVLALLISRSMLRRTESAEAALRVSEASMRDEQERAHVTLGSIHDGVISTDAHGRVKYLNPAAARITGWTLHAARGAPLHTVFRLVDEDEREPMANLVTSLLGNPEAREAIREATLIRNDESRVAADASFAPICDRKGAVIGVVAAFRDVSQERELSMRLLHQATHDALTGLVNRHEFERRVRAALKESATTERQASLLYVDLDQFKVVNDTSGHCAGDQLICQIAEMMNTALRGSDTLARLGGDEFGVLLVDCPLPGALAIAEKLRKRIGETRFAWRDRSYVVGASIGAVVLDATFRSEADVLSAADSACYLAKDEGRNRIKVYRSDDHQVRIRTGELEWVTRVASALDENRLVLYGQEIRPLRAELGDSRFEVLLRLVNEAGDLVAPMAFIPAAERYGMMAKLDLWAIDRAIAELGARQREGLKLPLLLVNLCGASIVDPGLLEYVREKLAAAGVPADRFGFELTETAAISNLRAAARTLRGLRKLGCTLGLDDFGSGMSSFGYLRSLPVDFVKIDGHFVRDMHVDPVDRAMVAAIHTVGHVMGLTTVAEWVEHEAAQDQLAAIGVDFIQGYAVSSPMRLAAALQRADSDRAGQRTEPRPPVRLVRRAAD
ncbi:MAG TPA: EAL domain-containing protein [Burkholderiaceae bacterium]|nr:EAL domain-containing protein [Burkholderiaceae bacterium]